MKGKIPGRRILIGELTWKRLIRFILCIYGALVTFADFFSDRMIFPHADSRRERWDAVGGTLWGGPGVSAAALR